MLRFHTQTAGSSLTAQQPDVNVVRTTLEALAAVLGGTQSLHTNGRDEALGLPTEESARLALRTQQVIAYESGVTAVPDPFGGSYYIEELTDRIEREATDYIRRIDEMGGALAGIEAGYQQQQIQNAAYEFQRNIESGKQVIVGVNRFRSDEGLKVPVFKVNPAIEKSQIENVKKLRTSRDAKQWSQSIADLEATARSSQNLIPKIVAAAQAKATVGEISDALRRIYGEYKDRG